MVGNIPWYTCRDIISSITIEKGITSIGTRSFIGCYNLTQVNFVSKNDVYKIKSFAFAQCTKLTSIDIPTSMYMLYVITFEDPTAIQFTVIEGTYGETFVKKYGYTYTSKPDPNKKSGIVQNTDGEVRYYVNNKPTYAGLVKDDNGDYYYISGNTLTAIKNTTRYITFTNDLLPEGSYTFGADGKMVTNA